MARLVRSKNKKIAGVCAGVAEHFGWKNIRNVRLLWVVLSLVLVGAPVLFYLLLCLTMPVASVKENYEERMNKRLGK